MDMPRTRLEKKNCGASKSEVAQEPASELSSDEWGGVEVAGAGVVHCIDEYARDYYEDTIESPPSKKSRNVIFKAEKGGGFNEALEKIERH